MRRTCGSHASDRNGPEGAVGQAGTRAGEATMSGMKRWLLPTAVLALFAAGWVWLVHREPDPPPARIARAPEARLRPAPSEPLPAPSVAARGAVPVAAEPAASASPVWDLCGLGRLPVPAGSTASERLPGPVGEDSLQAWLPAWRARLEAGDARARAASLLFASGGQPGDVTALVQLARSARDPVIWAWAFGSCGGGMHAEPCGQLDAAEWARDDPGNAWPWLLLGEVDPQRRREALAKAAKAARVQTFAGQLVDQVLRAAPPDMPRYLRRQPMLDAMGTEAMLHSPALAYLSDECGASGGRHADCQAVAEHLSQRADTWHGVGQGIALGERLGWSAERLAALRDERRRGEQTNAMPVLTLHAQPHACDALEGAERFVTGVAAFGETGAARQTAR